MKLNAPCYITTPIYYVNSKPHIGTLYSTLLADVTSRWNKLNGRAVFFLTGTDEHGQKIEERARELKRDTKEFVDSMIPAFQQMWKLYGIEYNKFIRTTDADHVATVNEWITKLREQGDIYKASYQGWYCVPCETFVTIEKDKEKKCPSCTRELRYIEEENYFFRLSSYQDKLLDFYKNNPDFIAPKERLNEVISFVKSGLKDLSISRKGVKWGIPFPGDPEHTVYVWADALNNYISAIGFGKSDIASRETFATWWPAHVHIMAKDIVRFHAVYWPAFLMAAGLKMPRQLLVHGFILVDQTKMSKSLGNAIDPQELADVYGVEQVRYYLVRQISPHQDGNFDIEDLKQRINSDLANNLGNLLSRAVSLACSNNLTTVNPMLLLQPEGQQLHKQAREVIRSFSDKMNHYDYHMALADLWKFISDVNAYFNNQEPWKLAKSNKELFNEVISVTCHSLYSIALLAWPVLPKKMEELLGVLGHSFDKKYDYLSELHKVEWNKTFHLKKIEQPLFARIEIQKQEVENKKIDNKNNAEIPEISIEDAVKVHLVVGHITSCEGIEKSDKLYKLQVDFGSYGIRQVLSGIKKYFKPEELIGTQAVFIVNLKPRKMMGLDSHGMILTAKGPGDTLHLIKPQEKVAPGTRLS